MQVGHVALVVESCACSFVGPWYVAKDRALRHAIGFVIRGTGDQSLPRPSRVVSWRDRHSHPWVRVRALPVPLFQPQLSRPSTIAYKDIGHI